MNPASMLQTSFAIQVIIAVIRSAVLVHADTSWVNETTVSLGQSPPLRSLRLPVVAEEPPKCLPPDNQYHHKNYCWFILEDSPRTQVHSGMLIRSNTSHTGWYSTLELIVLVPDFLPTDVGIWAEGYTFLKLFLPSGITVDLTFYVPRIGAVGEKDVGKDEKEIKFNVELSTTVNVPYMGTVTAKGEDSAVASIHTTGGMNIVHASVTAQGDNGPLSSEITFYAEVWAEDVKHWHYDCDCEVIIDGSKDGLEIHYEKLLPVFSQKS